MPLLSHEPPVKTSLRNASNWSLWWAQSGLMGSDQMLLCGKGPHSSAHTPKVFSDPQGKFNCKSFMSCRRRTGLKLGRLSAFSGFFFFFSSFQNWIHHLTTNKNSVKHSSTLPKLLGTHANRINMEHMGSKSALLSLYNSHWSQHKVNSDKSNG